MFDVTVTPSPGRVRGSQRGDLKQSFEFLGDNACRLKSLPLPLLLFVVVHDARGESVGCCCCW